MTGEEGVVANIHGTFLKGCLEYPKPRPTVGHAPLNNNITTETFCQ